MWWSLRMTILVLICLFYSAQSLAQIYPKLYNDGHGLSITAFYVQKLVGTKWVKTDKYEPNGKYRFRIRFTNFFKESTPTLGAAYTNTGIAIASISVNLKLTLARFTEMHNGKDYGTNSHRENLLSCEWSTPSINGSIGAMNGACRDVIAPEKSRWFSIGQFTWLGPPANVSMYPVDIYTSHRELIWIQEAPWGKLTPK